MADTVLDPFGTGALRAAVLSAWSQSPARFREDANAEEALATGGYADRLLVELAANGLDAARDAGVPGRVRFSLVESPTGTQLRVANVGAPLTPAGVSGLASLRASAKRGRSAAIGHFGVGFTAVVAVSDDPQVLSRSGGVVFSRSRTAIEVAKLQVRALAEEVAARDGQVPVLRLPWPMETAALQDDRLPDGFDTQVRLPLRTGLAADLAVALDALGDDLLWALPGLTTVEIERPGSPLRVVSRADLPDGRAVVTTAGRAEAFRVVTASGTVPAVLLADRPIEERGRNTWQLTWVLPEPTEDRETDWPALVDPDQIGPLFLGAPTPTDEPISLPARLVGTFPVDDTRRRLAPGELTNFLLEQACTHYLDLFTALPPGDRLPLVPAAGFPLGPVDAALRSGIVRRLSRAAVLHTAMGEPAVPSSSSVVTGISDEAAALLGRAVPHLLPPSHSPAELQALRVLGVSLLPLADATSELAGIDGKPAFWHRIYRALSDQSGEDLANLPVPLAGGGRRIGPAGCLLPGAQAVDLELLHRAVELAPELCLVHPDAAHPVLARLGAIPADAAALAADPALVDAYRQFRADLEDEDPDLAELAGLAGLALDLVTAGAPAGGLLCDVVLTDSAGEPWPAGELLAPGAALATVLAPDADLPMIGEQWSAYPEWVLAGIGVRTGLRVISVSDPDADLPDLRQWWSEVVADRLPPETFSAIADLDLIDDNCWPQLLNMITADADALRTLTSGPDPSYTRWWLTHFALLDGRAPNRWRLPEAVDLDGLYPQLSAAVDPVVARSIGVLAAAADACADDAADFIDRLTDPDLAVPEGAIAALTALAVDALDADRDLQLPAAVRTLGGTVVEAAAALVLDKPWFAQVIDPTRLVSGGADPLRVARVLELDLASEVLAASVPAGVTRDLRPLSATESSAARRAASALGQRLPDPLALLVHDGLTVQIGSAEPAQVWWWEAAGLAGPDGEPLPAGTLVTDGSGAGIGRAIAYFLSRWSDREVAVAAARGEPITLAENGFS